MQECIAYYLATTLLIACGNIERMPDYSSSYGNICEWHYQIYFDN